MNIIVKVAPTKEAIVGAGGNHKSLRSKLQAALDQRGGELLQSLRLEGKQKLDDAEAVKAAAAARKAEAAKIMAEAKAKADALLNGS